MKNLLNLDGVKALSKMEQKNVFGGLTYLMRDDGSCTTTLNCNNGSITCTSEVGNCSHGVYSISCDGIMYTCTV